MKSLEIPVLLAAVYLAGISAADLPSRKWWQHANVYQIYPRSFKDSNGDGIGDLPGITSQLDHLHDIGVNTIWMSPMFQSPLKDFGYDVSNFYEIHYEYGTMADFDAFIARATELGIGVLLDFVPNHSSNEMDWFVKSENREGKYTDYYVWHNGTRDAQNRPVRPNNWGSVFGGSGWTWSEKRQQWYFHQFLKEQPDLNYRNPDVVNDMNEVFKFWLTKGIAGFRVDAFNHMFEHADFPDEPRTGWTDDVDSYDYLEHIYTKDQQETYEILYDWRKIFDQFVLDNKVDDKILMVEVYASTEDTMRYYISENGTHGSQMPFNFQLIYVNTPLTSYNLKQNIDHWMNYMPEGFTPNWVTGSHDHDRVGSRLGTDLIGVMNTVVLTLPGTSVTYYGEEIGMVNNDDFTPDERRDPFRTPMQWDNTLSSGFSTNATTWLPIHKNYPQVNVASAKAANRSHYHHFKELTALRKEPTFVLGDLRSKTLNSDVFALIRDYPGLPSYVTLVNIGGRSQTVDLTISFFDLPARLEIVSSAARSLHRIGHELDAQNIELQPFDAIVLRAESSGHMIGASFIAIVVMSVIRSIL